MALMQCCIGGHRSTIRYVLTSTNCCTSNNILMHMYGKHFRCNEAVQMKCLYSTAAKPINDKRKIRCKGGDGGDGCISYLKHSKRGMLGPGWPSGGAGGNGGDVIVSVSTQWNDLSHLKTFVAADSGKGGMSRRMNGSPGKHAIINVPTGTTMRVLNEDAHQQTLEDTFVTDFDKPDSPSVTVAFGGRGGKGNSMSEPHRADEGEKGETKWIELELKSIADVGLVGFPNAGKSSILAAISQAQPKIAPYPFTTLAPHVGTVKYADGRTITVADIPGIIEGAHANIGLGFEFLRHIERTSLLVFVIDASEGASMTALDTFQCLRYEIQMYSNALANKPYLVIANKCDRDPTETLRRVDTFWMELKSMHPNVPLLSVSARYGDGIPSFIRSLRQFGESLKIFEKC